MMDFLSLFLAGGDLNISEFPTEELIQRLQRGKRGTTILGSPLCFLSQEFASGGCSAAPSWWLSLLTLGTLVWGLLASKERDLTYI